MKKLIALLAIVALLLPSCQKINDRIDQIEDRIDQIEETQIATINQQIEAINTTLPQLRNTDAELKEYIKSLQNTATNLQEQITNTNDDIDELEDALDQAIDDAEDANNTLKSELLSQLQTVKTALEAELAQINSTIATLQAKDAELEGKIIALEEYVNTELQNTEDWVTATFATLEQYNTIVEDIATIKTQIEALNTSLTNLEERLNTKITTDIAAAVEGLQSELATKVIEITTAYTTAISTAKEEITAAYIEAIAVAIANLESSMKEWVNEQLTGYYTIAEIDAQIEALRELYRETGHEQLAEDIESLEGALQEMKEGLTEAYQKAIEDAINTNNGVIDGKIAEEVATINARIDNEIATINTQISDITSRLDNVEAQISDLLSRIQSVTYVPKYSDGKATMDYASKTAEFDFIISPKSAVTELASVWNDALSIEAVYTQTHAVEFIDLPITNFEADSTNGVISLTVSGENLNDDFYTEMQEASAFLQISDGNSSVASEYIAMIINIKYADNVILYTTNSGSKITLYEYSPKLFGAILLSNKYVNGIGVMVFDDAVTKLDGQIFRDCNFTSITIPRTVTFIHPDAFMRGFASSCTIYCTAIQPPSLGSHFSYTSISEIDKIYVPYEYVDDYKNSPYRAWSEVYKDKIFGYDFEKDIPVE